MNCLSISFRTSDISIRKQLAFDSEQKKSIFSALTADGGECVVLCTCNRTEVYCFAYTKKALNVISEVSGLAKTKLTPHVSVYCGYKAEEHLFRLACGILSRYRPVVKTMLSCEADRALAIDRLLRLCMKGDTPPDDMEIMRLLEEMKAIEDQDSNTEKQARSCSDRNSHIGNKG